MLIAVAEGARWSVYSRDIGRNAPVWPRALQWKYGERRFSLRGTRRRRFRALAGKLFQQLDLDLLNLEKALVLAAQQVVDFFVKMPNFELGFEIDLVIVFAAGTVSIFTPVLAHHDHRRLQGRESGEHQIHQDIRVGIECSCHQHEAVDYDPEQQDCAEENDERPASAKGRDPVGESLAESELLLE